MALTIISTRNLPGRFHGFISSCLLEITPGTYMGPRINKGARERMWAVLESWVEAIPEDGGVVMFWHQPSSATGVGIRSLGWPKKELVEHEGVWLCRSNLTSLELDIL